ncbi:MAG TPA: hypothetical protein VGM90_35500 [Kofleriaceae bacterium]|jgi:hypothetical protein
MVLRFSSLVAAIAAVGALSVVASAEDFSEIMAKKVEDPDPGVQAAKAQAPSWCKSVKDATAHGRSAGALSRTIDSGMGDFNNMVAAAQMVCLWPTDPGAAHATQIILQHWMNWTGETQAQAIESLTLRVNEDKFKADGDKLCTSLKTDDEVDGEEKEFKLAELALIGCRYGHTDSPLWLGNNTGVDKDLFPFLDLSATEPSELVRLAWILTSQKYIFSSDRNYFDQQLVSYVVMQLDFKAISDAGLTKALSVAPYKDNSYARAVGIESEAMAHLAGTLIQKEVDTRAAKDPDWKTLLVTAPAKGIKDWTDMAVKYKDQIAHSNDFEKKWYGPSKKAYAGCWKQLHDDFLTVLKDQKHTTDNEVMDSLQNPIVSLLFGRLVACASSDKDYAYVEALYKVGADVRPARGARAAAYYAAVEAFGPIKADREKFPVEKQDLSNALRLGNDLISGAYRSKSESKYDSMGWVGDDGSGTVKSTKKIKEGLEVTFVQTKQQFMGRSCTPTNRIIQFRIDGSPMYYENCHDTGLQWENTTPAPIVVPDPEWETGIKAGAVVAFRSTRDTVKLGGDKHERYGLPTTVYSDKSKKKLLAWMGFAMP